MTNAFVSSSSGWFGRLSSVPGAEDLEGSKKGSPHSEQKK